MKKPKKLIDDIEIVNACEEHVITYMYQIKIHHDKKTIPPYVPTTVVITMCDNNFRHSSVRPDGLNHEDMLRANEFVLKKVRELRKLGENNVHN